MEVKSPAISNILKCRPLKYTHFAKCYDFHCYSYLGATKGHKVADIMCFLPRYSGVFAELVKPIPLNNCY